MRVRIIILRFNYTRVIFLIIFYFDLLFSSVAIHFHPIVCSAVIVSITKTGTAVIIAIVCIIIHRHHHIIIIHRHHHITGCTTTVVQNIVLAAPATITTTTTTLTSWKCPRCSLALSIFSWRTWWCWPFSWHTFLIFNQILNRFGHKIRMIQRALLT